jgi:hypothetical protein
MRKFLTVLAVILAVIWIANNPTVAAADVRHILAGIAAFMHGI